MVLANVTARDLHSMVLDLSTVQLQVITPFDQTLYYILVETSGVKPPDHPLGSLPST